MTVENLIVLGSGPAGLSAALYAARAELNPLVLTGSVLYGQASLTYSIENYPGFPEGVGGTQLGELFEKQATRFGARVTYDQAAEVDLSVRPFRVKTYDQELLANAIILAMGADPRKLNVPGEKEFLGKGVSYCATCDGWFFKDKDIHVVGGGDSAVEEALFLTRFAKSVTIVHRRDELRAGPILETRAKNHPKIKFEWSTVIKSVNGSDHVESLTLERVKTGEQLTVPSDGLFVFIGHIPNTQWLANQVALTPGGTVKVDERLRTNIPGVFAAGDAADQYYRQVVTSAGMGAAAAIEVVKYLESEGLI